VVLAKSKRLSIKWTTKAQGIASLLVGKRICSLDSNGGMSEVVQSAAASGYCDMLTCLSAKAKQTETVRHEQSLKG
jgi:hypothetical protein